jgi:guanosine-3',5'-bis(diphosphate) 3'-pyrophosphohydrolase
VDLGRKLLQKEVRRFDLNPNTLFETDAFKKLSADYGPGDEIFAEIGYGKVQPRKVLAKLVPQDELKEKTAETAPPSSSVVRRLPGTGEDRIKVSGIDDLMVVRARCCNPIRGEAIVGYITRGKGVSVHSAVCPNVTNLLYDPERRIDVEWDSEADASRYIVRLTVQVEDRKGILADVSSKIADINTNITSVEATTDDDKGGRINMAVEIKDVKHLERVIKLLRGVEGVLDVERSAARQ